MSVFGYSPTYQPTYAPQTGPAVPQNANPTQGFGPGNPMADQSYQGGQSYAPVNIQENISNPNPFSMNFTPDMTQAWGDPRKNVKTAGSLNDLLQGKNVSRSDFRNPIASLNMLGRDQGSPYGLGGAPIQGVNNAMNPKGKYRPGVTTAQDYYNSLGSLSKDQLQSLSLGGLQSAFGSSAQNLSNAYGNARFAKARKNFGVDQASEQNYLQQAYQSLIDQVNAQGLW